MFLICLYISIRDVFYLHLATTEPTIMTNPMNDHILSEGLHRRDVELVEQRLVLVINVILPIY